jgi:RNA-directed DNA polymerase
MRQMTFDEVRQPEERGETPKERSSGELPTAAKEPERPGSVDLMARVLNRSNMETALRRVEANRGSAGVDGMTTSELRPWLKENWPRIRTELETETYEPSPVRWHGIPKDGGGTRELGIPTVLDRLVQQALLQVLQDILDPTFSAHSHGFRPNCSAHKAVRAALRYIQEGRRTVVDVDLERFFDLVNHDILMDRLSKRIGDKRVLRLIRRFLQAGILKHGVAMERESGTPQGGPLSPLLANVLLDEVDKEMEKRGYAFVRYADDCNVYVRSRKAGERVMAHLRKMYAKLRLKVNESKSAVAPVWDRKFLGFSFWVAPDKTARIRVAKKSLERFRGKVRELTKRNRGRSMRCVIDELASYISGWKAYFRLAETRGVFERLNGWIRRRLRALQLKQWRQPATTGRNLKRLGASKALAHDIAYGTRRWWWNADKGIKRVLTNSYFDKLGLPSL